MRHRAGHDHRRVAVQPAQAAELHQSRPVVRWTASGAARRPEAGARPSPSRLRGTRSETRDGPDAPHAGGRAGTGPMRMTHQGRRLGVHARTSRPCRPLRPRRVPRPRCPVTPRPDHSGRTRLRPDTKHTHGSRHHLNRTGRLWLDKFHRSACNFLRKILHSASCRRDNACPVC
jgi:hypothetical protein